MHFELGLPVKWDDGQSDDRSDSEQSCQQSVYLTHDNTENPVIVDDGNDRQWTVENSHQQVTPGKTQNELVVCVKEGRRSTYDPADGQVADRRE